MLAQIDCVVEHTFGVKAKELPEDEWMLLYAKYRYLKEIEIEIQSNTVKRGVLEAFKIIFPNE